MKKQLFLIAGFLVATSGTIICSAKNSSKINAYPTPEKNYFSVVFEKGEQGGYVFDLPQVSRLANIGQCFLQYQLNKQFVTEANSTKSCNKCNQIIIPSKPIGPFYNKGEKAARGIIQFTQGINITANTGIALESCSSKEVFAKWCMLNVARYGALWLIQSRLNMSWEAVYGISELGLFAYDAYTKGTPRPFTLLKPSDQNQ